MFKVLVQCYFSIAFTFCFIRKVHPLSIHMFPPSEPMIEGQNVTLLCIVNGSKPAASITWFNGTNLMPIEADEEDQVIADNQDFSSVSSYTFFAAKHDNGIRMRCRGRNLMMENRGEESLEASLQLDIYYAPRISLEPVGLITKNYTDMLILNCNYLANPTNLLEVIWLRDEKEIIRSSNENDVILNLSSVGHKDKGVYTCKLTNAGGTGKSISYLKLEVFYPPVVDLILSSNLIIEEESKNLTMDCNISTANPFEVDAFKWLHNGRDLADSAHSVYILTEVDRFDTGNYTCKAHSSLGWGEESEPRPLLVHYAPSPAHIHYYPPIVVKGMSLTLKCVVPDLGQPIAPKYRWYHDGELIENVIDSELIINSRSMRLPMSFSCNAENDIGEGPLAHINVPLMVTPTFIQSLPTYSQVLETAKNVSLVCRVECVPHCTLHWLKNEVWIDKLNEDYEIVEEHLQEEPEIGALESIKSTLRWKFLTWFELRRKIDDANYTCVSSDNLVGRGINSSTMFKVEYAPENIKLSVENVNITEGDVLGTVSCSADAEPIGNYLWIFENEQISNEPFLHFGESITREQTGLYTCLMVNRHGEISKSITINVLYRPVCDISTEVSSDGQINIVCQFMANPDNVVVEWRLDNTTITGNITTEDLTSKVFIEENEDNFGLYECSASNFVGESELCSVVFPSNRH